MRPGVGGLRAEAITWRARVAAHCARFLGHFFVARKEVATVRTYEKSRLRGPSLRRMPIAYSLMVSVPVLGSLSVVPAVGLLRPMMTVSPPSAPVSAVMGMTKTFVVSPWAKFSVPLTAV